MGQSRLRRIDIEPCMLRREDVIEAMKGRKLGLRGTIAAVRPDVLNWKFKKYAEYSPINDIRFLDT